MSILVDRQHKYNLKPVWRTALIPILAIVVVPVLAFRMDEPLTALQGALLTDLAIVSGGTALVCFLVSSLARNYSQVDKLWSIMPVIYTWIIAGRSGFESRPLLMAVLVTVWGIRLTYNFNRRGGYTWKFWQGEEGYRWPLPRIRPELSSPWKWMLFNLFFISLYQMGLILLFTLPALKSMDGGPVFWMDYVLAALILGPIVIETVADFSESISAGKYPDYAAYQQEVPRFIPVRFRKKAAASVTFKTGKV